MTMYKCFKCAKTYATTEVRYSTGEGKMECIYCLGIKKKDSEVKEPVRETKKEEMIEYVCKACGYQFKRKKSFVLTTCPYCSKADALEMKSNLDANQILEVSKDKDFGN